MEVVLTIAGSDSSAGAGIQQDLKTITAHGCYAATVITSVTSQNTLGVLSALSMPADVVASQMRAVLMDMAPGAVKIGMLPDRDVAESVVSVLGDYLCTHPVPVIYDPVMVSTSGYDLMRTEVITYVASHLFPLCTLVTPNIPEARRLASVIDGDVPDDDVVDMGRALTRHYSTSFLLKGGHAEGTLAVDRLFLADGFECDFQSQRVASGNLHGTGCTMSSAVAACMATGYGLAESVGRAKDFVTEAIRRSVNIKIGHGNGPLHVLGTE